MMSCVFASSSFSSIYLTSGRFSNDSSTTVVNKNNRNVFSFSNTNQRRLRRGRRGLLAFQKGVVVSSSSTKEQEDYDRRFQESTNAGLMLNGNRAPRGGDSPPEGRWSWTLNWDYMTFDRETEVPIENPSEQELKECSMLIGSCPRSPGDIDRLIDEAGVEAIVCLQCELHSKTGRAFSAMSTSNKSKSLINHDPNNNWSPIIAPWAWRKPTSYTPG